VTLIVSNAIGCKDTITKNVFVNPLPVVDAGENQGICPGDSTIFVATGAQSYAWTPAGLTNCLTGICDSVKVWTAAPTVYYVSGTDSNKCVGRDSVMAFIQIKTETHVGTGGAICLGESFQLSATGATSYSWTPAASLNNAHISDPIATPQFTTIYVLEAQKNTCLISYDTIKVVVHPLPEFDAGFDETINLGERVVLHPTRSGINHIIWKSDTTLSCTDCFDPTVRPYYTKIYYATGYDAYGCSASDSVKVFVRCNGSMVFIPNTFTPNGDGQNDYFFPRGEGVGGMASLKVFNRWGQMVYERNNIALNDEHAGWDGTYKGQALAPDVYMYTMQARCEDGKLVTWKGDVTLVK
jgi:gliding motility-associated-like protein